MNPIKWKLHWQILLALALAIIVAIILKTGGHEESAFAKGLIATCAYIGELFIRALKMIVVPLIVASIISSMIGLGSERNFGRLGLKTLAYYTFTGLVAVCVGLLFVNIIQPGNVDIDPDQLINQADVDSIAGKVEGRGTGDIMGIFQRMIPTNVVDAASTNGSLLGVIVFSLLFGYFISKVPDPYKSGQENFWEGARQVMTKIADLVIAFAPIGVFGLVTPKLVTLGYELFEPLAKFTAVVALGLGFHLFITLSLILFFVAKVNPLQHMRAMASALVTAFSTASSVSTLPVTLECVEDNAGVSKRVASFTCPLGATVNMDGTALFECVVVIFIAQLAGVALGIEQQFIVVLLALLTSIGVAGIPAASMVAIVVILQTLDLPIELIALYMPIDRLLDMCRTAVNIYSDSCGAVTIARSEGENDFYKDASPSA